MLGAMGMSAQKISVASFKPLETDVTAITSGMKLDFSGNKCALIKVATTARDLRFEVGALGIVDREDQNDQHPAEIYLYVPGGVAKISIQHPELGSLRNYDLGGKLKPGRVYLLELTCDQVNTFVVDYNNEQMLLTKIFPKEASLIINGMQQPPVRPGEYETLLSFGTHKYRVSAPDYHPQEGTVKINSKDKAHELNIRLRQNYGYLTVAGPAKFDGSEIYLDDKMIGVTPINQMHVKSGEYTLMVKRPLYSPFIQKLSIRDSVFAEVKPDYVENFGKVKLSAQDPLSDIYLDGKLIGKADKTHELTLDAGEYTIEVRREAHRTMTRKINVPNGSKTPYHLPVLVPIWGRLQVVCEPRNAEVWLDGEKLGEAGIFPKVIIGEHTVTLRAQGYRPEEFTVLIEEDKLTQVEKKMSDQCDFTLSSSPEGAKIELNGKKVGTTPMHFDIGGGTYMLTLSKHRYKTIKKEMKFSGSTTDLNFNLQRILTSPNELYIQADYGLNDQCIVAGAGLYIKDFNLEAAALVSTNVREVIYWNRFGEETSGQQTCIPSLYKARVGYSIRPTRNMRFTPRLGLNYSSYDVLSYDGDKKMFPAEGNIWCCSAVGALKMNIAFFKLLGVYANCEYLLPLKTSKAMTQIKNVSSYAVSLTEGLHLSAGIYIYL